MGVLEEGAKAAGGVIEALRQNPLQLANLVLNIAFLVFLFYYVSIIARRAESTVKELFVAQDSVFKQWGVMVKDQQNLTEKMAHCILPEDAIKILQAVPRVQPQRSQDPDWLAPLRAIPLRFGPPPAPITKLPLPEIKPLPPLEQLTKPENKPEDKPEEPK